MARYLPTSTVDVTFIAWWNRKGRRPETVRAALDETIFQINGKLVIRPSGPYPPSYVPPPWRNPASAPKSTPAGETANAASNWQQEYDRYRAHSSMGVARARAELLSLERQFELQEVLVDMNTFSRGGQQLGGYILPPTVKKELALMRCYVNPADRQRREREILRQRWEEIAEFNKRVRTIERARPGNYITYDQYIARQKQMLADLDFLTKNTIGGGCYGLNRAGGRGHDDSMDRARDTQRIFDLFAAGVGSPAQKRYKMQLDTAPKNTSPRTHSTHDKVSPGWPYGPGNTDRFRPY